MNDAPQEEFTSELGWLKAAIEDGDSIVEACEQVDRDRMKEEGNDELAAKIAMFLRLADEIVKDAGAVNLFDAVEEALGGR